ncbi:hypothetical protein PPTG_10641 [Phytophthora nicotianae INRA-310]|uniref:Uncharacterized protein n=1 Tax=Phytophthora nicotianae (strain INRA-310) TaxID=761204 RepID=W2QBI7_PHYN3|nr:hypothetical protein PPTG_10641 [Phytophthora nicotianae INRA-310]ETN10517.1 hypothetical protein PPTG_10641 [Phytophthora nicotianae INRA-310]
MVVVLPVTAVALPSLEPLVVLQDPDLVAAKPLVLSPTVVSLALVPALRCETAVFVVEVTPQALLSSSPSLRLSLITASLSTSSAGSSSARPLHPYPMPQRRRHVLLVRLVLGSARPLQILLQLVVPVAFQRQHRLTSLSCPSPDPSLPVESGLLAAGHRIGWFPRRSSRIRRRIRRDRHHCRRWCSRSLRRIRGVWRQHRPRDHPTSRRRHRDYLCSCHS